MRTNKRNAAMYEACLFGARVAIKITGKPQSGVVGAALGAFAFMLGEYALDERDRTREIRGTATWAPENK